MKTNFIIICITILSFSELGNSQLINAALRRQIEAFRQQMPCGIGDGAPLAPLAHEGIDLDITNDGLDVQGYFRNILVEHLDQFILNDINFGIISLRMDFSFTFPKIPITGDYKLDANVMNFVRFWGSGPFGITAHQLDISGFLNLSIRGGFLNMDNFNATVTLPRVDSKISGLLGGGDLSYFLNEVISLFIPEFVQDQQEEITQMLNDLILPLANPVLNEMTLQNLLDAINSDSEPSEPCIAP